MLRLRSIRCPLDWTVCFWKRAFSFRSVGFHFDWRIYLLIGSSILLDCGVYTFTMNVGARVCRQGNTVRRWLALTAEEQIDNEESKLKNRRTMTNETR
jgi:hypothetical protein